MQTIQDAKILVVDDNRELRNLRQHRINTKSALYNRCQIKTVDNF